MIISDIFEIDYGQGEYSNKTLFTESQKGIPIISSKGDNNGIYGFYNIDSYYKNIISVARVGTICSAFYHDYDCCIDDNCLVLKPKKDFTKQEMLYFAMLIQQEKYKYLYGRQVTPKRLGYTKIPDKIPEYVHKTKIQQPSKDSLIKTKIELKINEWRQFILKDMFFFENCKCNNAESLLEDGNDIYYIGAKKNNNGIMRQVSKNKTLITTGNCIVFICDGKGSVGYSTYQPNDFIGSTTLSIGRSNALTKYSAMFLITILDMEKYKYDFGRKWNGNRLHNTQIKLPQTPQGEPDFEFMENYIKSLPYSSSL